MSNLDKEIDETLARYKNAYQIAFQEIDPHGNKMSPYNGQKAVSKRSNEIEMEAYNKLKSLIQTREKKMLEFVKPPKSTELDVESMIITIRKYWETASGEPELREFAEYILKLIGSEIETLKDEFIKTLLPKKKKHFFELRYDTDLEHGTHIGEIDGYNQAIDYMEQRAKEWKQQNER